MKHLLFLKKINSKQKEIMRISRPTPVSVATKTSSFLFSFCICSVVSWLKDTVVCSLMFPVCLKLVVFGAFVVVLLYNENEIWHSCKIEIDINFKILSIVGIYIYLSYDYKRCRFIKCQIHVYRLTFNHELQRIETQLNIKLRRYDNILLLVVKHTHLSQHHLCNTRCITDRHTFTRRNF